MPPPVFLYSDREVYPMKTSKRILNAVLALVFAFSMGMVLRQALDDSGGEMEYRRAAEIAGGTVEPTAETQAAAAPAEDAVMIWMPETVKNDPTVEALREIDLDALRQVNPDVIGWIRVPDTKIDYPVVQSEDNDFYLEHTWQGNKSSVGAIFMDCGSAPNLTDFNTLIYGHNMRSGAMFASLRSYSQQSYWEAHPHIYLLVDSGVFRFDVFSAYRAELDSAAYGQSFRQRETREKFLQDAAEQSVIQTEITPGIRDRILTLSTCSGVGHETRWVVQARLKMVLCKEGLPQNDLQKT